MELVSAPEPQAPDLGFLSRYPYEAQSEIKSLFATKHLMVIQGWRFSWMNIAAFCLELKGAAERHGVPELFEQCLRQVGPGMGELREMMLALEYYKDDKYKALIGAKVSPAQICAVVRQYQAEQLEADIEGVTTYDVYTEVEDLSFESLGSDDVLPVIPAIAGQTGEQSIQAILDRLGIEYQDQYPKAFGPCDFGEMKRPDFKVGSVKSKGDARLSQGFYIESTQRLAKQGKDLGLFYLLHQIVQYADLPTIVVYDGPALADNVWDWAQAFKRKHEKEHCLFAVVTHQQFREWALRKLGGQSK